MLCLYQWWLQPLLQILQLCLKGGTGCSHKATDCYHKAFVHLFLWGLHHWMTYKWDLEFKGVEKHRKFTVAWKHKSCTIFWCRNKIHFPLFLMSNLTSKGKYMHGNALKFSTVHFSLSGFMRYYPVLILSHSSLCCFSAGYGLKTHKTQLVGLPYHSVGPLQCFL